MTLVGLESPARLSAYTEKDGKVIFGYAGADPIAKDEIVAVLRLKDVEEPTTITVTETERSGKTLEAEPVTVEVGHHWGDWTVTKEATCTEDGEESRTCSVCGETETRPIAANSDHCPSKAFTDLDLDMWYHESVDYVLRTGLMNGMGNGKFAPNGTVTRAMMVTVLYRMAGEPEAKGTVPFTDVAEDAYYAKAVAWAYENHIVMGVTDTRFAPNTPATREQMATFLYRYAQFAGLDVTAKGNLETFPDGNGVSHYALEAMAWAVGQGLLQGDENGKLLPKNTATRAQMATVLFRFLET